MISAPIPEGFFSLIVIFVGDWGCSCSHNSQLMFPTFVKTFGFLIKLSVKFSAEVEKESKVRHKNWDSFILMATPSTEPFVGRLINNLDSIV